MHQPVRAARTAPPARQGQAFRVASLALALLAPSCGGSPAPAANPSPRAGGIAQAVRTFSLDQAEQADNGYLYWFFNKQAAEGRTLKLRVVAPNERSHAPHKHDGHEFFYVLEGQARFHLNGETRVVGPHTGLYCAPWSMHGIANAGSSELKYLVIKEYVEEFAQR